METIEKTPSPILSEKKDHARSSTDASIESTQIDDAALYRRIDFRLIPSIFLLSVICYLDRLNIGNVVVFGLKEDLKLKGLEYKLCLMMFFVPLILFEIPSNVLLKKYKPARYLSFCMCMFGVVTLCQGFVNNFAGLVSLRFLLGVFECGVTPGCLYLMSMWYRRPQMQKRFTVYYMSGSLAGACSGFMAGAIGSIDGKLGLEGWRWIWIVEGVLTIILAIICLFWIPNFPEEAPWLTQEEKDYIHRTLKDDIGDAKAGHKIKWGDFVEYFKDPKFPCAGLMYCGYLVVGYGYAFYTPTIIKGLFAATPVRTQILTVPVYMSAFVVSLIIAIWSDQIRKRFWFVIAATSLTFCGNLILRFEHQNRAVQYMAVYFGMVGNLTGIPLVACWYVGNMRSHNQKAIASAVAASLGNLGGFISSFIFQPSDGPEYKTAFSIALCFLSLVFAMAIYYYTACRLFNRKQPGYYLL